MDFQSFSSCQFVEGITLGSLKTPFMQNRKYFCSCAIGLRRIASIHSRPNVGGSWLNGY